jgi:RNA polymerase sigma factor (sigma-70 family)
MAGSRTAVLRKAVRSVAEAHQPAATDRELLHRFARENDQGAFETLVNRHTAMVLGVCRRALPTVQDAEDACQATFLVLANRAKDGRWQESVANWLYTTARKVAHNARVAAERRAKREARAAVPEAAEPVDRMTGRELLAALDDALDGLPPHYREPLVLCYLEGLTRDEAAARLGVPLATLHTRIDRARKRLHAALTKAGCALGVGLLALAVTSPVGASPPRLVESILATASGPPPGAVAELAKGVAVNGAFNKAVLGLLIVGVVALGVGLGSLAPGVAGQSPGKAAAQEKAPPKETPTKPAADDEPTGTATYAGTVVGPDGKPVGGAKVYALYYTPKVLLIPERGTTDKDGRFRFSVEKKEFDRSASRRPWDEVMPVAVADGYGFGVPDFEKGKPLSQTEWTIRLTKDDVPITGRVLNLQGQPVAGATVSIHALCWPKKGDDLTEWLAQLKKTKEGFPAIRDHLMSLEGDWMGRDVGRVIPPAVTDAEGRFRLKGIGRERVVELRIEGPTIVSTELWAMTRPGEKIEASTWRRGENGDDMTFVGANADHYLAPSRPIVGVVTDADTGKPILGAIVESYVFSARRTVGQTHLRAVADKDGRYRLTGMPKGEGNLIRFSGPDGEPYLMAQAGVPDSAGLEPVTVDRKLTRGVWITGQVTDKATGKPVHSIIHYAPLGDNPNAKAVPRLAFPDQMQTKAGDGTFRFAAPPGRGVVAARAWNVEYLTGVGRERIKGAENLFFNMEFHTFAEVNPAKDAGSVTCDLVLEPGRTLTGTILGPDGKPLTGAQMGGARYVGDWDHEPRTSAEFTLTAVKPGEPRLLQFMHAEKKLAGSLVVRGDEKEPLSVKLEAAGVLTGRFVTTDGKALADLELFPIVGEPLADPSAPRPKPDLTAGTFPRGIRTDKDGKFRIEGVAPGLTYRFGLRKGFYLLSPEGDAAKGATLKAGEAKDLGDLKVKLPD